MGTQAGVGTSHHRNVKQAGQEAVQRALTAAGIDRPDFVFLFASLGYDQQKLVQTVWEATGGCPLAGCSGQGVITQNESDESSFSVAVMVIRSDELRFNHCYVPGLQADPLGVGTTIASKLQPLDDAQALFLFTDGIHLNFDRLVAGIESGLPRSLPMFGGAAGSDAEMRQTFQYYNDRVISDGVVATLLSGKARVSWAMNHSCVPIGYERQVTRSVGNVIYEIDHKPVFEVLREYLSEKEIATWDRTIVSFCFGLRAPHESADEEYVIRYLPSKDDATQSVTLQTEVAEGTSLWITRRDPEKVAAGIDTIAAQISQQLNDQPAKLVFQFDCYGRGKSLFSEQQKLTVQRSLQQQVGAAQSWIGLYTHGEIAPLNRRNAFHNYTLVLVVVH
jgi:hypothetical protein